MSIRNILYFWSVVILAVAGIYVYANFQTVYFLVFHKPFSVTFAQNLTHTTSVSSFPHFQILVSIDQNLSKGTTTNGTITITTSKDSEAVVNLWITSPMHKQAFRYQPNDGNQISFLKGKTYSYSFQWIIAKNAASGKYILSDQVQSPDNYTDYYFIADQKDLYIQ